MDWHFTVETAQWIIIVFLFFKGAWNENRIDTLERKR